MNTAQVFAALHLAGTCLGIAWADRMPWWLGGLPAYVIGLLTFVVGVQLGTWMRRAWWTDAAAWGVFWGAMTGALAADFAGIADWLTWPGHTSTLAVGAAITTSFAWAFASVAMPLDHARDIKPARVGFALYLIVAVVSAAPLLVEVL
jgi:hypothetical protein